MLRLNWNSASNRTTLITKPRWVAWLDGSGQGSECSGVCHATDSWGEGSCELFMKCHSTEELVAFCEKTFTEYFREK